MADLLTNESEILRSIAEIYRQYISRIPTIKRLAFRRHKLIVLPTLLQRLTCKELSERNQQTLAS